VPTILNFTSGNTVIGGGNTQVVSIDSSNSIFDIRATTASGETVNTNNFEWGVSDGNSFKNGEFIKFSLIQNIGTPAESVFGTTQYRQQLAFVQGGAGNTTSLRVGIADTTNGITYTNRAITTSDVKIYNSAMVEVLVGITKTVVGGEVLVSGLLQGYRIEVSSSTAFEQVTMTGAQTGNDKTFKLGQIDLLTSSTTKPVDLDIPLSVYDKDGDATAAQNLHVVLQNYTPSAGSVSASVQEEALGPSGAIVTGTNPASTQESTQGNLVYNFGNDGANSTQPFTWNTIISVTDPETSTPLTLTSRGLSIQWQLSPDGKTLTAVRSDAVTVAKLELLDVNAKTYKFTLLGELDHPDMNQKGSADPIQLQFGFVVKDSNGDSSTGNVIISVLDDAPIAGSGSKSITEGVINTNLLLILDVSGSMAESSGLTGLNRLDVLKRSVGELLDQYDNVGDIRVRVVIFSSSAAAQGGDTGSWVTLSAAKNYINSLGPDSLTNYDAAIDKAQLVFGNSGKLIDGQNVSYFLSDGFPNRPTSDPGIQSGEQSDWETFLKQNDIKSFALAMGPNASVSQLEPISYDGQTETDLPAINVSDFSQLTTSLTGTIATLSSNLLTDTNSQIGADQPGYIKSIGFNNDKTYTYDPISNAISVSGSGNSTYSFNSTTHVLIITTATLGVFEIDLDNGSYIYKTPNNLLANTSTNVNFTVADYDGDSASGNLTLNLINNDLPPIVRDDYVFTNVSSSQVVIPEYALLYNDKDPEGSSVTVTGSASNLQDVNSILRASGNFTFNNNDSDGGSFDYSGISNGKTDNATVNVNLTQAGETKLDGTYLDDILIDNNNSNTLDAYEGNDVLIGNTGNDTLNPGIGNDLVVGGGGSDTINLGNDGQTDIVRISSALDGKDTINQFNTSAPNIFGNGGDILDLHDILSNTPGVNSSTDAFNLGYLTFSGSGSGNANTDVRFDSNGSSTGGVVTTLATFNGVAFTNANNAIATLADNIQVQANSVA
jgi:hypothetical protein